MAPVQPARLRLRVWSLSIALAAAAPLLLGACGKSATSTAAAEASSVTTTTVTTTSTVTSSTASTSAAPGGSTHEAQSPKQQALAYAKAVNLRASDLPGYSMQAEEHEHESASEKQSTDQLLKCLGTNVGLGSDEHVGSTLAEADSPKFDRRVGRFQHEMIQSFVIVASSSKLPTTIDRVFKAKDAQGCLASFFRATLDRAKLPKDLHEGREEVDEIAAPANAFGWRLLASLSYRSLELPLELDLLGFSSGRAFVLVSAVSLLGRFDPSVERHAVTTLMARAKSHSL